MTDQRSEDPVCVPYDGAPCQNTDRHLWPEVEAPDAPVRRLFVTAEGAIGINVGGYVYVKPIEEWHKLAGGPFPAVPEHRTSKELLPMLRAAVADERLSTGALYRDAADEIERLRAELVEAQRLYKGSKDALAISSTERERTLEAERDRLQTAYAKLHADLKKLGDPLALERMMQERDRLREVIEWTLTDMSYCAPEEASMRAIVWDQGLRAALAAGGGE